MGPGIDAEMRGRANHGGEAKGRRGRGGGGGRQKAGRKHKWPLQTRRRSGQNAVSRQGQRERREQGTGESKAKRRITLTRRKKTRGRPRPRGFEDASERKRKYEMSRQQRRDDWGICHTDRREGDGRGVEGNGATSGADVGDDNVVMSTSRHCRVNRATNIAADIAKTTQFTQRICKQSPFIRGASAEQHRQNGHS